MLQQTPLAVTGEPPSLDIFPPLLNNVAVTAERSVVVNVGAKANVLNEDALLYPVPTEFVA